MEVRACPPEMNVVEMLSSLERFQTGRASWQYVCLQPALAVWEQVRRRWKDGIDKACVQVEAEGGYNVGPLLDKEGSEDTR